MNRVVAVMDRVIAAVCVVVFALLVLTVVWQVFSRQVLNAPSTWSEELARYEFVWLGLFAAALVFSERGHIAVDAAVRKLRPAARRVVAALVQVAVIVFALAGLVWGGLRAAAGAWDQQLTALPTQLGVMYLALPVSGLIIAFYAVTHLTAVLQGDETVIGSTDVDPAA